MKRFLILLSVGFILVNPATGNDFQFFRSTEEIPERGKVESYRILMDTMAFTLIPPAKFSPQTDAGLKKIILNSDDRKTIISLQFMPGVSAANGETLRGQIMLRHPDATILQVGTAPSRIGQGHQVDYVRMFGRNSVNSRVISLPFSAGAIEVGLTTSTNFQAQCLALQHVLGSLKAEAIQKP